jgi:hypothetical protein
MVASLRFDLIFVLSRSMRRFGRADKMMGQRR